MLDMSFDENKANAFAERFIGVLNNAALVLMTSIGHRTGLFDAMRGMSPANSAEIAAAAGLQERYVREWLNAMATGKIVDFKAENGTYRLPAEHAAFLTRAASPNNLAVTTQFFPVMASVEDEIVKCFREGGGVPYSSYSRFHETMAEESNQTTLSALTSAILPLVGGLTEKLEKGIAVLEIGCGSGRALNLLAKTFPNSRFTGCDFSEEAVANAQREAFENNLSNVRFVVKDVATIGEIEQYDLALAFDAIHDQAAPAQVLENLFAALRPGGTFLMQDIAGSSHVHKNMDLPLAPYMYTISCLHCMTVSLACGGAGLGAMWGEETARQMLADAGFQQTEVHRLEHDIINYYYIAGKI